MDSVITDEATELKHALLLSLRDSTPEIILGELWDIMNTNIAFATGIYIQRLFRGKYHEASLNMFKKFYAENWRSLSMETLSDLATIFVDEPLCASDYKDVCMRIKQLMRLGQEGVKPHTNTLPLTHERPVRRPVVIRPRVRRM